MSHVSPGLVDVGHRARELLVQRHLLHQSWRKLPTSVGGGFRRRQRRHNALANNLSDLPGRQYPFLTRSHDHNPLVPRGDSAINSQPTVYHRGERLPTLSVLAAAAKNDVTNCSGQYLTGWQGPLTTKSAANNDAVLASAAEESPPVHRQPCLCDNKGGFRMFFSIYLHSLMNLPASRSESGDE